MLIAVISDIHNHVANLRKLLVLSASKGASNLICCGDITRPETLEEFLAFPGPARFCLGNCDLEFASDLLALARIHSPLHGFKDHGTLDLPKGPKIAFTHTPSQAARLAENGSFAAVFHGHTHQRLAKLLPSGCLLANPGDVEGRSHKPSALLWESEKGTWEFLEA
jgi:uncharacterized protein